MLTKLITTWSMSAWKILRKIKERFWAFSVRLSCRITFPSGPFCCKIASDIVPTTRCVIYGKKLLDLAPSKVILCARRIEIGYHERKLLRWYGNAYREMPSSMAENMRGGNYMVSPLRGRRGQLPSLEPPSEFRAAPALPFLEDYCFLSASGENFESTKELCMYALFLNVVRAGAWLLSLSLSVYARAAEQ